MCTAASFRRFARTPECIERDARFGLAALALDLQPAMPPLRLCATGRRGLAGRDFVLMEARHLTTRNFS
jgi:hypothetical protein